jgi:hypothetical protein
VNAADVALTEEDWQAQVTHLAHLFGWQHLHVRHTVGRGKRWTTATNVIGWPDLFLWHPRHGFAAIELKVGRNRPTDEQLAVLSTLHEAGAATMVAYPTDFERVRALLERGLLVETAA